MTAALWPAIASHLADFLLIMGACCYHVDLRTIPAHPLRAAVGFGAAGVFIVVLALGSRSDGIQYNRYRLVVGSLIILAALGIVAFYGFKW
jgi:hypothetical protein